MSIKNIKQYDAQDLLTKVQNNKLSANVLKGLLPAVTKDQNNALTLNIDQLKANVNGIVLPWIGNNV